jgi:hypothetical protein
MIAEPPVVSRLIGSAMKRRIAGEIALVHLARIECGKFQF